MKPILALADDDVLLAATSCFAVRHSPELPTYYELALEDGHSEPTHWVVPLPLKQLAKRPVLLWLLSASALLSARACVETGDLQLVSNQTGTLPTLRTGLAQGVLRLHFSGQLLRGYFRLQCLPTGCGKIWQLTPIGCI